MSKKSEKSVSLIQSLVSALKVDEKVVREIAALEKTLLMQKANKEANKQKVTRQKMRSRKFYRHEHTAETIAQLQKLAATI
jgi:hypothetical protein